MSSQTETLAVPPVEAVVSEVFATLALAAHTYLEPVEDGKAPDLAGAEIAIDLAGRAFERAEGRLSTEERAAMAGMLTNLRMAYVRKRGS